MNPDSEHCGCRYRFGPFEVDARSGELFKLNHRLHLREQPFQILLMLLAQPGAVVLRDEICLRLWPDNPSVDVNHGINTAIKQLRDALGETAAAPRYLETVGRRGYRFLGEPAVIDAPAPSTRLRHAFSYRLAAMAAFLLAGIGWRWLPSPGDPQIVAPITALPGVARDPSISPDGSKVAFTWGGDLQDNVDIYVKDIGSGAQVRLTVNPASDEFPTWSPDGRFIAFVRSTTKADAAVMLIPSLGGAEREVFPLGPRMGPAEVGTPVPLSWTPDSQWLAVAARDSVDEPLAIWLISVQTSQRRRLTSPRTLELADTNPSISPDGALLAFSRGRVAQYAQRLYVVALSPNGAPSAEPRPLNTPFNLVSGIAWSSPREIVYSGGGGATAHLFRLGVSTKDAPARLIFGEDALCPSISKATRRLAYAWRNWEGDIWRLNTHTGERRPFIVARGVQAFPQYSPDCRKISFASTRSGDHEIWTCDAEGANCIQLTSMRGPQTGAPHWSPDGRWLLFDSRPEGIARIYRISSEGGAPIPLFSGSSDDFAPRWSYDGEWIYFVSGRSGRWEIWKAPARGGPPRQLTKGGALWLAEAPAEHAVYFTKPDRPGLYRIPAAGGEEAQVLPRLAHPQAWALTGHGIYFYPPANNPLLNNSLSFFRRPKAPVELRFQEFGATTSRVVSETEMERLPRIGMCSSPDGTYVLGSSFRIRSDIMLVEHFR